MSFGDEKAVGSELLVGFYGDEREGPDAAMCLAYWQLNPMGGFVHTVASLGKTYNLPPSTVSARVEWACRACFPDVNCTRCGQPHLIRNRSDYANQKSLRSVPRVCQECKEAEWLEAQRAEEDNRRCRALRVLAELEEKRAGFTWIPPARLAFEDAVFLLSLFRAGGSENLSFVVPHPEFVSALSPTTAFDRRILDRLYQRHVIAIHPGSSHDSVAGDDGAFTSFYPFKVQWTLPLPKDGPSPARYLEDLETLLKARPEWPADWDEDAGELQLLVAFEECLEYLRLALEDHGFKLRPGPKLSLVLRAVLRKFSIGQTYNFIWRATKDAAAFYVREQTVPTHAANIVPGAIQRMAERALVEGWAVKPYRRDRRVPESQVSHVLFTLALGLPEGGFNSVPPAPPDQDTGGSS